VAASPRWRPCRAAGLSGWGARSLVLGGAALDLRRLVKDDSRDPGIWSIVCFLVVRRLRGRSITRRLIQVAVDHAWAQGASILEAYPVEVASPSWRFMGFVPVFEKAGFREVGRTGKRRHVMQLRFT